MKRSLRGSLSAIAILVALTSGCASKTSSASKPSSGTRYIYLPPDTSSRVPRRVAVGADGSTNSLPSSVQTSNPDAFGEQQRKGSVNRATGN